MTWLDMPRTMCEAFQWTAGRAPDDVAVRAAGDAQMLTWREYAERVRMIASGLSALGVRRGDTVALMMGNRVEFYPLEVGAQHLGATTLSVDDTASLEQLHHVLTNAGTKVLLCEQRYVDRIRQSKAPVEHIVCIDGASLGTVTVDDLIGGGTPSFNFDAAWRSVQPDDVVSLIYTSGTPGPLKAVEMTHANLLFEIFAVTDVRPVEFGDRITPFLPSAHIVDRLSALYLQEVKGTTITVVPEPEQ